MKSTLVICLAAFALAAPAPIAESSDNLVKRQEEAMWGYNRYYGYPYMNAGRGFFGGYQNEQDSAAAPVAKRSLEKREDDAWWGYNRYYGYPYMNAGRGFFGGYQNEQEAAPAPAK